MRRRAFGERRTIMDFSKQLGLVAFGHVHARLDGDGLCGDGRRSRRFVRADDAAEEGGPRSRPAPPQIGARGMPDSFALATSASLARRSWSRRPHPSRSVPRHSRAAGPATARRLGLDRFLEGRTT